MSWTEIASLLIAVIALVYSWSANRKYLRVQERVAQTERELLDLEKERERRLKEESRRANLFAKLRVRDGQPQLLLSNTGPSIAEGIDVMLVDAGGSINASFTIDIEKYLPLNHLDAGQEFVIPLSVMPQLPATAELSWSDSGDIKRFRPQPLTILD